MGRAAGLGPSGRRRPFGVRLYLALSFAAVALITGGLSYLLVGDTGERDADEEVAQQVLGRTSNLANEVGQRKPGRARATIAGVVDPQFAAWIFDHRGRLISPREIESVSLDEVPNRRRAVRQALIGARYLESAGGGVTIAAVPRFRNQRITGAVLVRAQRPPEVEQAIEEASGQRLTALLVAVAVALLISFLIASAITSRVKRLADSAARISEGGLEEPLEGTGGRDEITDLGRALERMRGALRQTFGALREERDRLSAIFEALSDAVLVVHPDGEVRFFNAAANPLIDSGGYAIEPLIPWLRRAAHRGTAENDALRVGDRVYWISARQLPAEGAVLAVVRDRTDELRREVAEREFVSNAAHELRNPIAGISGAIEVLQAGAKDDPEAREHFLARLSEDSDRISRLTDSLLTLARMEAVGEGGTEAIDIGLVVSDVAETLNPPEGIAVKLEVAGAPVAQGDRVLLRQVLIGLLTNAYKNTPPPGEVTVRAARVARRGEAAETDGARDAGREAGGGEARDAGRDGVREAERARAPDGAVMRDPDRPGKRDPRADGDRDRGDDEAEAFDVLIEVADTGTGIAPEEIDRIFERFYRGSGSLEQQGFGLGLSIARRMVDVMGGEIGVESTPGVGSTFWVRLPAAKPAETPVA